MRNYLKTKSDVVVVIVSPVVVDVGQTTVVRVTTDQPVIALEFMFASPKTSLQFDFSHHCILSDLFGLQSRTPEVLKSST